MDHKIFDSSTCTEYLELKAPYYNAILDTKVVFEQEKVSAFVNSLGHIEFFDGEENSLGFVDVPVSDRPYDYAHSAQYGTVECMADGGKITFRMPVYDWDDYYPNCDGESDRWNRLTIGWFSVIFDCTSREISITEKEYLKER